MKTYLDEVYFSLKKKMKFFSFLCVLCKYDICIQFCLSSKHMKNHHSRTSYLFIFFYNYDNLMIIYKWTQFDQSLLYSQRVHVCFEYVSIMLNFFLFLFNFFFQKSNLIDNFFFGQHPINFHHNYRQFDSFIFFLLIEMIHRYSIQIFVLINI